MKSRWITIAGSVVLAAVLAPMTVLLVSMFQGKALERWSVVNDVMGNRIMVTFILAAGATLLAVAVALPFALAMRRSRFFGRTVLRTLYVMPLLIPPHIQGIAWMRVVGRQGLITIWLKENYGYELNVRAGFLKVGGIDVFYPGATWMLVAAFWPLAALVISAGLARLDPRAEEAALLCPAQATESASRVSRIWNSLRRGRWFLFLFPNAQRRAVDGACVPLLRPHILAGAFFVFIFAASCYPIPALLDTPSIMIDIFFEASQVDSAAAGVVSAPLVVMTVLALIWVTLNGRGQVFQNRSRITAPPESLTPKNRLLGAYAWMLVAITSFIPLYALFEKAGGIETYRSIWRNVESDIHNSFSLAAKGALWVVIAGCIVAMMIVRGSRKRGFVAELAALLPFAFPAVVVGVAMNRFWGGFLNATWLPAFLRNFVDEYVYQSSGIFYFCYMALFLPFALRCILAAWGLVDPRQVEAGLLVKRSDWARFRAIILPVIRPGIAAALLLAFILSLGELAAGLIVQPPDASTVQIRIFNMIHFARDEEVAALCVMIVAVSVLPTLAYTLLFNRKVEVL